MRLQHPGGKRFGLPLQRRFLMNQEQFGQFWEQLKAPLRAKWEKTTDQDLTEIQGNLATFAAILQKRYGDLHKEEVSSGLGDVMLGAETMPGIQIPSQPCNPLSMHRPNHSRYSLGMFDR